MGQFLSFCLGLHLGLTDTSKGVRALAWGELCGFVSDLTALMQGAGEESLDMFDGNMVHLDVALKHLLNNCLHLRCILLV